jgi:hypothetical protein
LGFRPATRPGLDPAGEVLLLDDKRTQKRLLNVHALHPTAHSFSTVCSPPRTEAKYCSIRARASSPWARSTLRRRNAARHPGAPSARSAVKRRSAARGPGAHRVLSAAPPGASAGIWLGHPECSVHSCSDARARMGQYFDSVLGGEHTVPNAVACPGVHERSKTFLGPFVVQQKDLACRGETRPRARTET